MSINLVRNSNDSVNLEEVIEGQPWKQAQQRAFQQLKANLNPRGFRPGRVPDQYARKLIGEQRLLEHAALLAAQDVLDRGLDQYDLILVERPELKLDALSPESATVVLVCKVEPELEPGNYKELSAVKKEVELNDEEVQSYLDNLLKPYADWVVVERPVQSGDQLLVDYVSLDEEGALKGATGSDLELVLDANPNYKSVYSQLLGLSPEQTKTIDIVFPNGQTSKVDVTVNEISELRTPELTEEIVQKFEPESSVEEFEKNVRERLLNQKKFYADSEYLDQALSELLEPVEVEYPESLIQDKVIELVINSAQPVPQNAAEYRQLRNFVESQISGFYDAFRPRAVDELKAEGLLLAIAKAEGLEPEQPADTIEARNQQRRQKAIEYLLSIAKTEPAETNDSESAEKTEEKTQE